MKTGAPRGDLILSRLFLRLLPVQAAIAAMGSINSIVDGVFAARFVDAGTVGVIGLYYTMIRILEATGSLLTGGVSILCGKYLGGGKVESARGVCTLGLVVATAFGAFLTVLSFAAPYAVANLLGTSEALREALATYIRGYAIGILPMLLGQLLAVNLQLERQEKLGHAGITVMIVLNLVLDIYFVAVRDMGVRGLALSTSLANWGYFLVVAHYFFRRKAQLTPNLKLVEWKDTFRMIRAGFPNALLILFLAIRSLVINRVLLSFAGEDGLSALTSFNLVSGLILSAALGTGGLVRMLSSVFLGEENREGLLSMFRLALRPVLGIMLLISAAVVLLSPALAGLFFPDRTSEVFRMSRQLFFIYGFCVPLSYLCILYSSYYQAAEHRVFVNLISLMDGCLGVVIPAVLLAPVLGVLGVWLAFPIGLLLTLGMCVLYPLIRLRRRPAKAEEWLLLPPGFGRGNHLVLTISDLDGVSRTAMKVQNFCVENGLPGRIGAHAGLCLEELAGNIVRHGFGHDRKTHAIEIRVVPDGGDTVLRVKDDCISFNPEEWYKMSYDRTDPVSNVGIRLVFALAEEVVYQNLLGLNVTTVRLSETAAKGPAAEAAGM